MQRHLRTAALAAAAVAVLVSPPARAGQKINREVTVSATGRYFLGQFGDVRNSADSTQYIWCQTTIRPGGTSTAFCGARSLTDYGSCTTDHPNLVRAIRSLHEGAWVQVTWDADRKCTTVNGQFGSPFSPKR